MNQTSPDSDLLLPADLLLLANRYASGDLSSAQSLAFEAQLAQDQQSREALASVVRIEAALLAFERPLSDLETGGCRSVRRSPSRRWTSFVLGITATVVACGLLVLVQSARFHRGGLASRGDSVLAKTAAVWTSLARPAISIVPEELDAMVHLTPVEVPDWMFAAVNIDGMTIDGGEPRDANLDDDEDLL
jgi:hypothetical protein